MLVRSFVTTSEKSHRLATGAALEARLVLPVRDVDHMHRAVALTRHEQFVAVERHVHRLAADLDGGLLLERRIDQADGVAVEARDAQKTPVRRVARDLSGLRYVLQPHLVPDALARGVYQEQ